MSVLEAAATDGAVVPWRISSTASHAAATYDTGVTALIDLMEQCWDENPDRRPLLRDVQARLQSVR